MKRSLAAIVAALLFIAVGATAASAAIFDIDSKPTAIFDID